MGNQRGGREFGWAKKNFRTRFQGVKLLNAILSTYQIQLFYFIAIKKTIYSLTHKYVDKMDRCYVWLDR